jgi:bile acid-coenzyme A ligase
VSERSYGRVLSDLARVDPDRVALVVEDEAITRASLETRANRLARTFAARGVRHGDIVSLCLPNGIELVAAMFATWKLGAVPNPLSDRLTPSERSAILDRADPRLVVGLGADEAGGRHSLAAGFDPGVGVSADPLEDRTPPHERALASGGSTGLPKLIIPKSPASYDAETASPFFRARRAALVPGPIDHAAPFSAVFQALLGGSKVVLMRRFDAARFLELVEMHRIDRVTLVPTMMLRIWRLPEQERLSRDVSSLERVMSGGAPLPAWLMRAWIDWLGPGVMCEAYGPSERIGGTFITGDEWLEHPGSVGRPTPGTRIQIRDDAGQALGPGQMGEIYMLPQGGPGSTYRYVGAEGKRSKDGWESVGDMGYVDEAGYLFLGDRRSDMIVTGGQNVYPAEVEAAIDAHAQVRSSAVIGLPDEELGQRIHAIIEADDPLDEDALRRHLQERLSRYKLPRSFERVDAPLRDEAGKLRRSALRAERAHGEPSGA